MRRFVLTEEEHRLLVNIVMESTDEDKMIQAVADAGGGDYDKGLPTFIQLELKILHAEVDPTTRILSMGVGGVVGLFIGFFILKALF